jgi:hypothetical protein
VSSVKEKNYDSSLFIAFPKSNTELALIFSEPVDRNSAELTENYITESNLKVLAASVDAKDPKRVLLTTEPMNGDAMKEDVVRAIGVRTTSGANVSKNESPRFIQGIANITETQKASKDNFPYSTRFAGRIATMSCQKNGGADSVKMIDALGFSFLHRETGGPFNSIKVICNKHVPGITEEAERLKPQRLSPHVLWAGGEIRNTYGENQLVDTGFMEGSIMPATPKKFPPTTPIKTVDISGENAKTFKAKSLQGVIVRIDNITIDNVSSPDEKDRRPFVFHDDSGAEISGLLLDTFTKKVEKGQKFQSMRGIVHLHKDNQYQVIVELDEHLLSDRQISY